MLQVGEGVGVEWCGCARGEGSSTDRQGVEDREECLEQTKGGRRKRVLKIGKGYSEMESGTGKQEVE